MKPLRPKPTSEAMVEPASRWRALFRPSRRCNTAHREGTASLASRSWRPRGGSATNSQAATASSAPGIVAIRKASRQPNSCPIQPPPAAPMNAPIGGESISTLIAVARFSGGK